MLKDLEKFDEAVEVQKKSIELKPTEPRTSNNLGTLLEDIGRFDEAEKYFAKAVELDGNYATAKYNLGGIKLRKKEFADGWAQREMRWWRDSPEQEPKLASTKPQWNGEPVDRLFVWSEQGVGDEIMFAGCYNELAKSCRQLTISVSGRLLPIMQRSFPKNIKFIDFSKLLI